MHELLAHVLLERDLSRAGDLFAIDDRDIEADLKTSLIKIQEISDGPNYLNNINDQSVVEICMTRFTSAIRETCSIERHAPALVSLLESCLKHNLSPVTRDEDPPHAKIASDILSCIFLNYSNKTVIELVLPIAVHFLTKGNNEVCRSLSSYLSLCAFDSAKLLAAYLHLILDSIIIYRNRTLIRILPNLYVENREPLCEQIASLLYLLPDCEQREKCSVLQLCCLIAAQKPRAFADVSASNPSIFLSHVTKLKQAAISFPNTSSLVARILGNLSQISKFQCRDSVSFLVSQLATISDSGSQLTLLRMIKSASSQYPHILFEFMPEIARISSTSATAATRSILQQLAELASRGGVNPEYRNASSQTDGIVTVVGTNNRACSRDSQPVASYATVSPGPSRHNASTSTQELCAPGIYYVTGTGGPRDRVVRTRRGYAAPHHVYYLNNNVASTGVVGGPFGERYIGDVSASGSLDRGSDWWGSKEQRRLAAVAGATLNNSSNSVLSGTQSSDSPATTIDRQPGSGLLSSLPTHRQFAHGALGGGSVGRPSLFHPQPKVIPASKDFIRQFCEKHSEKIKMYIEILHVKIPIPVTVRVRRDRNQGSVCRCIVDFVCQAQTSLHCLYRDSIFSFSTKHAKIWVHLTFLMMQCRSSRSLCSTDPSVAGLTTTWESVNTDSTLSFVKLVTSAFPTTKDQTCLLHELESLQYFDVFEFVAMDNRWSCFLCHHPEKVTELLRSDGLPTLKGQLKGKRGRLKALKPWKTRTFTLSGTSITYLTKDSQHVISNIQTVRTLYNKHDLPTAFEVFTDDHTSYVFKASDARDTEQWIQCLQIAVAQAKRHNDSVDCDRDAEDKTLPRSRGGEMPRWASLGRPVKTNVGGNTGEFRRNSYSRIHT